MLAGYLTGALLTVAALVVGQAAIRLCGARRPSPLAPAVGISLLMIVADLAIKLPGRGTTAWIGLAVLLAASVAVIVGGSRATPARPALAPTPSPVEGSGPRQGWSGVAPLPYLLPTVAALLAGFAASIPFLANGRMGPLGAGLVNDDMASHLLFTDWLMTHAGDAPQLVAGGYPLGPHSLVATVAKLTTASPVEAFAGLTFAIAALTALTAYGALDMVRPILRVPAAALTALPYLGAAYLAQGAFKEPMLALFLFAFALGLRQFEVGGTPAVATGAPVNPKDSVGPTGQWPVSIPLGVIAAGTLYLYSFPGEAWLIGTAVAWGAIQLWWARRGGEALEIRGRLRGAAPAIGVAMGILVLAAFPELGRLIDFASFNAFDPENVGTRVGLGNLRHALTPLEGFNVWPSSEFRVTASSASAPAIVFYAGALVGIAALAYGLLVAYARRESALPAALIVGAWAYVAAVVAGTPYTSAKALAIVAPVAMLIALRGLLGERPVPATPLKRLASIRIPLASLFVMGAVVSSFLPLRAGAVGPSAHADQLRGMKPLIGNRRVLFLGRDQFAADELIGSKVATPILNYYNQKSIGNRFAPTDGETVKLDFDAVTPALLDTYSFVVTTRSGYQSAAPPNFRHVATTPDYLLWKRTGPTPPRQTLSEPNGPGAILDCSTPQGRRISRRPGTASVFPAAPVVGSGTAWGPSPRVTNTGPASQELKLSPGRWSISLQYSATQKVRVSAPGLDATLPANLDFRGPAPFWRVGEIEVARAGRVNFTFAVDRPPLFGRLIHADALAFPLQIAATMAAPEQVVPLRQACGRYLDFYVTRVP